MDETVVIRDIADADLLRPWNDPYRDIAFARQCENSSVLVGLAGDLIVGSAMVGHDGHRGWLYYVSADPSRRGEGIGRAVVSAAERWLADHGIWKVQLLVRADNQPAAAFYEHLGYVDTQSRCFQKVLAS